MRDRFALDHLTVTDTTPSQLIEVAAETGYRAVCMFLEPMEVLPRMPSFQLVGRPAELRDMRKRMDDGGISLDVAYPFTLASRTDISCFIPLLEAAAALGAWSVNALVYDRDPVRRVDRFGEFCLLAKSFDLKIVVEFFPLSQVRSLGEALELCSTVEAPGSVGVNVDLLHLQRSGSRVDELAAAPPERILYAQYCDAPAHEETDKWGYEASSQRMLAGEGALDIAGFARALPRGCRASVELPQESALVAGQSQRARAQAALESVKRSVQH